MTSKRQALTFARTLAKAAIADPTGPEARELVKAYADSAKRAGELAGLGAFVEYRKATAAALPRLAKTPGGSPATPAKRRSRSTRR